MEQKILGSAGTHLEPQSNSLSFLQAHSCGGEGEADGGGEGEADGGEGEADGGGDGDIDGGGDGEADGGGDGDVDGGDGDVDGGGDGETDGGGDGHASIGSGTVVQVNKPEGWHTSRQACVPPPACTFQTQKLILSPAFCQVLSHPSSVDGYVLSKFLCLQPRCGSTSGSLRKISIVRPSAASWASM